MKRVGIITLYGLENYGNRLQNYAVQKILSDMGMDAKSYSTDLYYYGYYGKKYRIKKAIHELTGYHLTSGVGSWAKANREMAFEDFTKRYLPSEKIQSLEGLSDQADYFVLGSDQVWNANWYGGLNKEVYLLTFARPEQKVCISPSFGIDELPEEWKPWFKEHLQSFPSLNVREQAGADIIYQLTGRTAEVTIDPTLMLDRSEWLKIAKKPYGVNTNKPFLLTYFLGDRTERAEHDISEILAQRKMNVFHLLDETQPFVYACGPREFLYLFSKADIVLTDSFHACVFSFLFGKPFIAYDRVQKGVCQMNSRIITLTDLLELKRKYAESGLENEWFECDYSNGRKKLAVERDKVRNELRTLLV